MKRSITSALGLAAAVALAFTIPAAAAAQHHSHRTQVLEQPQAKQPQSGFLGQSGFVNPDENPITGKDRLNTF